MNLIGKSFFVTGADGFIGSHLVEQLVNYGANVKALVAYNSWNEVGWLKDIDKEVFSQIEIVNGDIRDSDHMFELVKGCDYVMHLSSLIAIPYSYHAPRSYVETNIIGALNILQACRKSETLTRLLHVSTSETYGSAQYVPIDENHPLVGQSPYSASKIGADKIVESYHLSFDLPVVTARPFNTYGPRQTARAVIPTIASQLIMRKKQIHLGTLSPTRDFNFVTDTARGMLELALAENNDGEVFNIGSGEEWSIGETFRILSEISGYEPQILSDEKRVRPKKSEVNRLLADNSKIKKHTNWNSEVSFRNGLETTYNWIEKNIHLFDIDDYAK
jgi:NAD dependent epimerase/dehydratase